MIVVWEVTRACDLVCRHCRAAAMRQPDPAEIGPGEAPAVLDQVARAGPKIFILTGGDPVQRPDLPQLIEGAAARGLRVALSPSATPRFLAADLGRLRAAGLRRISLSLDGATERAHDAFRGVPGAWAWTMEGFRRARAAGLTIQVNTTITRHNIGDLDRFAAVVRDLQPETWSVFQLIPTGRGRRRDLLDADEMEALCERLHDLAKELPFPVKTTEGQQFRRVAFERWRRAGSPPGGRPAASGINDGRGFVFISHTGDVCPSGFLPLAGGNVRAGDLLDIYRDAPLFRELRDPDRLRGKCGRCPYREVCGGSRARAYAMTGDYLETDPLCGYDPAPAAPAVATAAAPAAGGEMPCSI